MNCELCEGAQEGEPEVDGGEDDFSLRSGFLEVYMVWIWIVWVWKRELLRVTEKLFKLAWNKREKSSLEEFQCECKSAESRLGCRLG